MKRHYKKIIIGLFIGLILISFYPMVTHAQMSGMSNSGLPNPIAMFTDWITGKIGDAAMDVAIAPFTLLFQILRAVLVFILTLVSFIFGFVLDLNFEILNPISNPSYEFITVGWSVVRDVANLGLVLVIILIALATIMRFQDWVKHLTL